jgi:hypothetical protein
MKMSDKNLTPELAYLAMYEFFYELYQRTKSDDLGVLLGSMSYLANGQTADPAIWNDWMRCITKAMTTGVDANLKLSR